MSLYEKKRKTVNEINLSYEGKYLLDPRYMTKRDLQFYYRYYNITKKRKRFKKIIIIILSLCFFSYIFIDYNLKAKLRHLKEHFEFIPRIDANYNVTEAYFVNLPGCRMPYFPITDDNIVQFMFKPENFTCKKSLMSSSDDGSYLYFNMNAKEIEKTYGIKNLTNIKCNYTEIERIDDQHNRYLNTWPLKLSYTEKMFIRNNIEFLMVECWNQNHTIIYKDFHFFIIDHLTLSLPKENVRIRNNIQQYNATSTLLKVLNINFSTISAYPHTSNKNIFSLNNTYNSNNNAKIKASQHYISDNYKDEVSVMILGIDSVSHLNFLRQMRNTASYIRQHLNYAEFWGYNKVGDNTYPNLMPVLSGLDETELGISCLGPIQQSSKYDRCSFIWKRFKEAGYKTIYAEDVGLMGLFNYCRAGFKQPPTDFYLHPIVVEMEQHISYMKRFNVKLCKGGRRTVDLLLEYIRKLIPFLVKGKFFSFFWTVTMTHDMFNMPMLLDNDIKHLFEMFNISGILNRTVIFLMSDHGLRWGSFRKTYQGMMEERLPLLMTLYPEWLKMKYPEAIANMQTNTKRLTTPFDLYATLLDLIDLRNIHGKKLLSRIAELHDIDDNTMPRGISLFLPVPEQRSCEMASIASHWCCCHEKQDMVTNDGRVQKAARYIVKLINERLKVYPQCRTLYLNSILEAILAQPHHKIVKEEGLSDYAIDITLRIQTKPGLGLFESTVRMSQFITTLTGTISRINLYSSQSYCINDYALKMFCYCHR